MQKEFDLNIKYKQFIIKKKLRRKVRKGNKKEKKQIDSSITNVEQRESHIYTRQIGRKTKTNTTQQRNIE